MISTGYKKNEQTKQLDWKKEWQKICQCAALAGVAQLVEAQTCNQRVAGSIPQGTCLG